MTGLHGRPLGLLTLAAAAGLLAACATTTSSARSGGSDDAIGGPGAAAGVASDPRSTSPSAGAGGAGGGSAGGLTPECTLASLSVSPGHTDEASGHRGQVLVFTNTGTGTCWIHGYPGVAGLDSGGAQVAQAVRTASGYLGGILTSGMPAPTVDLAPGQSASALVEAMAFTSDGGSCTPYAGLLVTPPDETHSTRVDWREDGCAGLQVHPVVPGTSGRL